MSTTMLESGQNFSNLRNEGTLTIEHPGDRPSVPADLKAAVARYEDNGQVEDRIVTERGPGFLEKAKHRGQRALALSGVAAVSAVASLGTYDVRDELYDFIAQPDPVTRTLTPEEQQNVMDRPEAKRSLEQAQ